MKLFTRWLYGASVLAIAALACACSQTTTARTFNYGKPARVTCASGGKVVFDDYSTGRVENEEHSDGYGFVSKSDGKLLSVSGDCTIEHGVDMPDGFKAVRPYN